MAEYGSTFLIQELTDKGDVRRTIALVGAGLPKQGAPWATKNRTKRTNYPGNKRATSQIFGTAEMPSDFEFMWRMTMISRTPATLVDENGVTTKTAVVKSIVAFVESLLSEGRLLRVSWIQSAATEDSNIEVVREGTADDWSFTWIRAQDCDGRIKFGWNGRKESRSTPIVSRGGDIYSMNSKTRAALDKARTRAKPIVDKPSPTVNTLAALGQLARYPTTLMQAGTRSVDRLVSQIDQLGDIVKTASSQPASIVNSVISTSMSTVSVANQFVDKMSRVPLELQGTKSRISDLVRQANFVGTVIDAHQEAARAALDAATDLRAFSASIRPIARASVTDSTSRKDIITVHVVRDGDTLMSISSRYYGTPDQVNAIIKANRLPFSIKVASGTPLVIPVIDTTSDSGSV